MFRKYLMAPMDVGGMSGVGEQTDDEKISADVDLLEEGEEADGSEDTDDESEESGEEESEDVTDDSDDAETDDDSESEDETEDEDKDGEKKDEKDENLPKPLRFSEIKAKYPEFFKDFPQFRGMVAGYYQYNQLFPSVEDAKEAAEVVQNYNNIAESIFTGKTDEFLNEIKGANEEGFNKFVNNLLPGLFKADERAYYKIATPIVDNVFRSLYTEGINSGDKNKTNSAIIAFASTFGLSIEKAKQKLESEPESISDKKTPEQIQVERERNELLTEKYQMVSNRIDSELANSLDAEFKQGIGPDWTEFEKKTYLKECYNALKEELGKDANHSGRMKALWKKEQQSGFAGKNADSIKNAVLSRAKASIPAIRLKVKTEMGKVKSSGKKAPATKQPASKNKHVPTGKSSNFSGKRSSVTAKTNPRNVDWRGTSDLDILNDNVKFRS